MAVISVDFSKKCGKVKIMHAVNNGPAGSKVRQAMNNFDSYRDAEIPYARLHDSAFYSFHGYRAEPYSFGEDGDKAYKVLEKYGLVGKTELILNEWNYVKGWTGDNYRYSMRAIRGLKGSSFIAGTMCAGQKSKLDMMMYYDARPCTWNGMFDYYELQPLKGYYPFKMYSQLYEMGECVSAVSNETCVYCVAAEGDKSAGLMVTYYMDDDGAGEKDLWIKFDNFAQKGAVVEYYLLDENHDMELVRSEKVNSDSFTSNLTMSLYSTYFIKIIK